MPKTKYMTMEDLVLILTLRILENDERLIEQCDTYKITNYYDILARLQKVKSHAPFFLKLVSQIQQALSENTTEAKKFMQSLDLIITAFDTYGKEQGINRNWKKLLNALHNKKLQYRAIKAFQDKTFGYDYFENTILITECANNPYASAQDILWYCIVNDEPIDSPMFKRGLKKFDEEFKHQNERLGFVNNKTNHVCDALDTLQLTPAWIWETNKIFPFDTIDFEGYSFNCPNDIDHFLSIVYGPDYMSLPDVIDTHDVKSFILNLFSSINDLNDKFEHDIKYLREINDKFDK